jgi:molybdate/tungstate transport system ATP-binding protein
MLEVTALTTAYDSFRLGPLDLSVADEVLAVLGPSGCGKTTLLSSIAGIASPDGGAVELDGRRLDGRPPEARGTVLVFQDGALFPHMTARENVAYAAGADADGEIEALAAALEIGDVLDRRAATLSGGEGQRVALARALAADPDALLLDEPLANLDAPIRRRLRSDLRDLLAPLSIPVVYVTHDQTEASGVGDRVAVMRDGQFEQIGSPTAVFERPRTRFVASFTGGTNVFRTGLEDGNPARIRWGPYRLDAGAAAPRDAGDEVWFCVRPEYVEVVGDRSADAGNVIEGRIADRTFEGGTYRLVVRPEGVDAVLEIAVLPPAYDRHRLDRRDHVAVEIPADAVHLLGDGCATDGSSDTSRETD